MIPQEMSNVKLALQPFSQLAVTPNVDIVCAVSPLNYNFCENFPVITHILYINGVVPLPAHIVSSLPGGGFIAIKVPPTHLKLLGVSSSEEKPCSTSNCAAGVVGNLMQLF